MKPHLVAVGGVLALFGPAVARGDEPVQRERSYLEQRLPAPARALELTIGSGYTQGFGELRSGMPMLDVASAGVGIDGSIGYRIAPRWGISIGGQYQELTPQNAGGARGTSFTIAAQYHIAPTGRLDPWIELGAGHRLLWQVDPDGGQNTLFTHGTQLARARIGFDVRLSSDIAMAPVIGADATMFLWQDGGSSLVISDPSVTTFVFAGVQGRIDIGATPVGTTTLTRGTPAR